MEIARLTSVFDADIALLERGAKRAQELNDSVGESFVRHGSKARKIKEDYAEIETAAQNYAQKLDSVQDFLKQTERALVSQAEKARSLGDASAVTARMYERFKSQLNDVKARLESTSQAMSAGSSGGRELAKMFADLEKSAASFDNKLKDNAAHLADLGSKVNATNSQKLLKEEERRAQEVARINAETTRQAQQQSQLREKAAKTLADVEIKEENRVLDQLIKNSNERIKAQKQQAAPTTRSLAVDSFIGNLSANVVSTTTGALKEGAQALLDYSSKLEQARIGFTTMTGSATLAEQHLKELQTFAAKTPFEFGQLVTASQKLQGVGVEAKRVVPLLTDVGNALAASGRLDSFDEAIKALGDIQAKGKLAGQEVIQLANAGLPALDILSKALGKPRAEILRLSEQGSISAGLLFESLHKVSQERFGDAMEKQSHTFQGALSNIDDALYITSEKAFEPLYNEISHIADETARQLQTAKFEDVGSIIGRSIGKGLGAELRLEMKKAIDDLKNGQGKFALDDFIQTGIGAGQGTFGEGYKGLFPAIGDYLSGQEFSLYDQKALDKQAAEAQKEFQKKLSTGVVSGDSIYVFDTLTNTMKEIKKETEETPNYTDQLKVKEANDELKKLAETQRKYQLSLVENQFNISKAQVGARIDLTDRDRIQTVKLKSNLEDENIRSQIKAQQEAYDEEIRLNSDNKVKAEKLTIEKNQAIAKLNAELKINSINTNKEIAVVERQILEQRRAAAIQSSELELNHVRQSNEARIKEIQRGIDLGTRSVEEGYGAMLAAESDIFSRSIELVKNKFAVQLQNERLTGEECLNLTKEQQNQLEELEINHQEKIIEIRRRKFDQSLQLLKDSQSREAALLKDWGSLRSSIIDSYVGGQQTQASLLNAANNPSDVSVFVQMAESEKQKLTRLRGLESAIDQIRGGISKLKEGATLSLEDANQLYAILDDWKDLGYGGRFEGFAGGVPVQFLRDLFAQESDEVSDAAKIQTGITQQTRSLVAQAQQTRSGIQAAIEAYTSSGFSQKGFEDYQINLFVEKQKAVIDDLSKALTDAQTTRDKVFGEKTSSVTERTAAEAAVTAAQIQLQTARIQQQAELSKFKSDLPSGLQSRVDLLNAGDLQAWRELRSSALEEYQKESLSVFAQIAVAEQRLVPNSEDVANRRKLAHLNALNAIKDAEEQAVERQIAAQAKLAEKYRFSSEQFKAAVLENAANTDGLTEIYSNAVNGIGEVFANSVRNWDGTLKGFFKSVAQGFADLLKEIAAALIKLAVIKLITKLIGGSLFGGGDAGGTIDNAGSFGLNFTPRATGGPVSAGRSYIVGEREPEVFVPRTDGMIYNQQQLAEAFGGGGKGKGGGNTYNISVPLVKERNLAAPKSRRQLADDMVSALQRNGK